MDDLEREAGAFVQELQNQPEEVRQVFLYAICQTMVQAGTLQFLGAFRVPKTGVTLLYKNPDSGEVFEIVKPRMTELEEQAMTAHIRELLDGKAQAV